jgi:hypothetical protein
MVATSSTVTGTNIAPTYRHRHAECDAGQSLDKPPNIDFVLTLRITRRCRTIAARPTLSAVVARNGW